MSTSGDNGKITQKGMSKLFSFDYDPYDMVKYCRNVNFKETDSEPEPSTEKVMDFDHCEEYLKSISNEILLWQC